MTKEDQLLEIGEAVVEMAEEIFRQCGAEDDFCIQAIGNSIVFGGTNRIKLTNFGWLAERSHCTPDFYQKFRQWVP